jgi:hypothetical protein
MERIGQILVEMNACTQEELRAALQAQAILGGRIGTNLLELGLVDEAQLAAALTRAHGLPCLAGDVQPEAGALEAVPAQLADRYGVVPIHVDDRRLRVAVSDPRDLAALDDLAFATGRTVEPVLAPEARLWALMRSCYGIDRRLRGIEVADELEDAARARGAPPEHAAVPEGGARSLSAREALDLIDTMTDPLVLSALLLRGAGAVAARAVLLKCRCGAAVAWLGAGRHETRRAHGAEVTLARDVGPFGAAVELRAPSLAPLRDTRGAARFFEALGSPLPMNALVAPVILRGRAVALLYADAGPGGTLRDEVGPLLSLVAALNARLEAVAPVGAPA